jgi:hypothetical protein
VSPPAAKYPSRHQLTSIRASRLPELLTNVLGGSALAISAANSDHFGVVLDIPITYAAVHDQLNFGHGAFQHPRGIEVVHHWHREVKHDQIGMENLSLSDGFVSICGLATNREVGFLHENLGNGLASEAIIVHD